MGILSRKAEMQSYNRNLNITAGGVSGFQGYRPNTNSMRRNVVIQPVKHRGRIVDGVPQSTPGQKVICAPVLNKRYTDIVMKRNKNRYPDHLQDHLQDGASQKSNLFEALHRHEHYTGYVGETEKTEVSPRPANTLCVSQAVSTNSKVPNDLLSLGIMNAEISPLPHEDSRSSGLKPVVSHGTIKGAKGQKLTFTYEGTP